MLAISGKLTSDALVSSDVAWKTAATMDPEHIDVMLAEGISFDTIEERIDAAVLPESVKNMLWLYAWAGLDREGQRRALREMFDAELASRFR